MRIAMTMKPLHAIVWGRRCESTCARVFLKRVKMRSRNTKMKLAKSFRVSSTVRRLTWKCFLRFGSITNAVTRRQPNGKRLKSGRPFLPHHGSELSPDLHFKSRLRYGLSLLHPLDIIIIVKNTIPLLVVVFITINIITTTNNTTTSTEVNESADVRRRWICGHQSTTIIATLPTATARLLESPRLILLLSNGEIKDHVR
mmetsp:Transcript_18726/g.52343  ORF Transcript_18726/g.52343 Transcript_18726/m.52343 type:complete len:200 (+) Transcript_18726:1098-1697(+)